jgi:hypothetical protein
MLGFTALGQAPLGSTGKKQDVPRIGTLDAQMSGSYAAAIVGAVAIVGAFAANITGGYASEIAGGPVAQGSLEASLVGEYQPSGSADVIATGLLDADLTGTYSPSGSGYSIVLVSGAPQLQGDYEAALAGDVDVNGALATQMTGAYKASIIGDLENGFMDAEMTGVYSSAITGVLPIDGALSTAITGDYSLSVNGELVIVGSLSSGMVGSYDLSIDGGTIVAGELSVEMVGQYVAAGAGSSSAYVPRDPAIGLIRLVEIEAYDPSAEETVTLRFGTKAFVTLPTDSPANAYYEDRLESPGDYQRSLFSSGMTTGVASVGSGEIILKGGEGLDYMEGYAFDGRTLRILSIDPRRPLYTQAAVLFAGTMEQIEFTWRKVTIRMRDRLAELNKPIQSTLYAGTTISGSMNEAEGGPDDLKGKPKPLCLGAPLNVPVTESNAFNAIFDAGQNGFASIAAVRDKGVLIPATGTDYSTITALIAASIPEGKYSTAKAIGSIGLGSPAVGTITVDPVEGATAADRTAAQLAKRVLLRMGMTEGADFLASDIAALDAINSAPLGLWIDTSEVTALDLLSRILNSIGASISPDRLGVFRMFRFNAPAGSPKITLGADDCIDRGEGIERIVTDDDGRGLPATKVTTRYAFNYQVMTANELNVPDTTQAFKTFAVQEWRSAVAEDASVKMVHPLAVEMTFDTYLLTETDAQAEADRKLALHSVPRSRFMVPVKSALVERIDLNDEVRLEMPRFGLAAGKDFRVIGIAEDYKKSNTTLDLWG